MQYPPHRFTNARETLECVDCGKKIPNALLETRRGARHEDGVERDTQIYLTSTNNPELWEEWTHPERVWNTHGLMEKQVGFCAQPRKLYLNLTEHEVSLESWGMGKVRPNSMIQISTRYSVKQVNRTAPQLVSVEDWPRLSTIGFDLFPLDPEEWLNWIDENDILEGDR